MLKPHTNDDRSAPSGAGSAVAWLAHWGMVALLAVEEPSATRGENTTAQSAATLAQEPADPIPDDEPEEALLIRLSAQKLWAEGRANPVWFECRSWIGDWQTDDRVTWRTTDGVWLAQLHRSPNGRRVFLRLWRGQTPVGHQDEAGWHPATVRSRSRQPRPVQRSLPAAGWLAFMVFSNSNSNTRNGSHDQSSPAPRFVHTDVISAYSTGSSPSTPDAYIRALARQYPINSASDNQPRPAIAIADYGLHSAVKTAMACDREGVDHLVALRVRVVAQRAYRTWGERTGELILLAMDETGWLSLGVKWNLCFRVNNSLERGHDRGSVGPLPNRRIRCLGSNVADHPGRSRACS